MTPEAQPRSLLYNSSLYVLGQLVSRALGFLLLLVYARYLQPEDFGVIGTVGAYGAVLSTFLVLGLHGAVSKHYFDHRDDPPLLRSYLSSVFAFQGLFSLAVTVVLVLSCAAPWQRFTSNAIAFHPYVELMLWTTFLSSLALIPQTLWQARERAGLVVGWQVGQALLAMAAAVLLVVVLRQGALGVLRAQAISAGALALGLLALFARSDASADLHLRHVASAARFGLPLVPHSLGGILLQTVDRIMLERYAPLAEVGLYSIAMTLGLVLATAAGAVNQAWAPHFFRTSKEEPAPVARAKAEQFAALFIALFAALSLCGGLLAPELARLCLGERYLAAVPFLLPLVIGTLIGVYYYLPANQLFLAEETGWFPLATGLAAALSVGLNLWWLRRGGGGMAAAWVFVIGNACQAGIVLLAARRRHASLLGLRHGAVFLLSAGALAASLARPGLPLRASLLVALLAAIYLLLVRDRTGRRRLAEAAR